MDNNFNTSALLYWVSIKIYDGRYPSCSVKAIYRWTGPWHVRTKWDWYFKYRAALAQVDNPRCLVHFNWGTSEPDKRTRRDFIMASLTTKKRMITKISNELKLHKKWLIENNVFGLDGDDGRIEKAEKKLSKYQAELTALESELKTL